LEILFVQVWGLGPGTGLGEYILPSLGRWTNNLTTPMGNGDGDGDGGIMAYFHERAGVKGAGLSDAMSTP
jgi:hypothetical protein